MGIFARNRTQLSKVETGYDLSCRTQCDSMDIVIESYVNDLHVFESILQRDLLESIGVLTESSDDNSILSKLWQGILDIIEGFKKKINTIFESICDSIDNAKSKYYESQIKKTESEFDKADLSGFTIKNFKLFNYKEWEKNKEVETVLSKVLELDIDKLKGQPLETITLMKNKDFAVYGNIKSSLHDVLWSKTNSVNPFKDNSELKTIIKSILKERAKENTTIKRSKKKILDHLNKQETIAKRMLKEAKKQKNVDKSKKEHDVTFARECNALINEARRVTVALVNSILAEYKKIVSTSAGLYKAASKYAKKQQLKKNEPEKDNSTKEGNSEGEQSVEESYINIDYLSAIYEASLYEFESCIEDLI